MTKCIITKLQATVADNNIPKMGVLRVRIAKSVNGSAKGYISIGMSRASKAVLIPDSGSSLEFVSSDNESLGLEHPLYGNTTTGLWVRYEPGYLEIHDKYAIETLAGYPMIVNVADLAYCGGIKNHDHETDSSSLDLRNIEYGNGDKSYGDITGIVSDAVISPFTVSQNAVEYDMSRLPKEVKLFSTAGNTVGVYCSTQNRTGANCNVITTGLSGLRFKTANDARNFVIANAGCEWVARENPNIEIITMDNTLYYFDDDAEVLSAVEKLKAMGVAKFIINGVPK